MVDSIQKQLSRVRPPRVHITYDVEIEGAIVTKELAYVIGVIADLVGDTLPTKPLKDRKFVEINRDNFNRIMQALRPTLNLVLNLNKDSMPGHLAKKYFDDRSNEFQYGINLRFRSINSFEPLGIINQVPLLQDIYRGRKLLHDLITKMDGNDLLLNMMEKILKEEDLYQKLKSHLVDVRDPITQQVKADFEKLESEFLKEILDKCGMVRHQEHRSYSIDMLQAFVDDMENAKMSYESKDHIIGFLNTRLFSLDQMLSKIINDILHDPRFQALEASWRGLLYLVRNAQTSTTLKIRLLSASRQELIDDFSRAIEFDHSNLFKKIYEEEYGTFGGDPFSCLMLDYYFSHQNEDVWLLTELARVAAAAHAPLISGTDPKLFDLNSFKDLGNPRDLSKIFDSEEVIKWRNFRQRDEARYVALTLPRVLMRETYGTRGKTITGLGFEEDVDGFDHNKYCWGNPAYFLVERIANSFSLYGWVMAIRGVENGGLVSDLPIHTFRTLDGEIAIKCPTEIAITDRREKELSDLGFISLCHNKGSDSAVFFSGQTVQQAKTYNKEIANANARLSTCLPYLLTVSRFAHYVKAIMRDKIGRFTNKNDVTKSLNAWIVQYVLLNENTNQTLKAKYPLRAARVTVHSVPNKPGSYQAVILLRPHFQLEELTTSLRLVARLPVIRR